MNTPLENTANNLLTVLVDQRHTEEEKAVRVELFTDLIRSIERCQTELLEMMEEQQKAAEKQEQDLIEELEQEITELKMRNTELEQLSHTEDHLHLLEVSQHDLSVRTFIVLCVCVCCVMFFPVLSVSLTFTFLGCC